MKITAIKQQVKRPNRYSVYGDGKFLFGLSENGLLQLGLHIGKDFEPAELAKLKESADFDKLYDLCLRYIALRLRSEWEVRTYLKRKDASPDDTEAVVQRLYDHRWLDDAAFARAWINNRRQLRQTSKRRLQQELRAKQVSADVIAACLAEDETDELAVLRELIVRKQRLSRYASDSLKLMQYLVRQGFAYGDVKRAMGSDVADD